MEHKTTPTISVTRDGYISTGDALTDIRARRTIGRSVERRFAQERTAWAAANAGHLRTRVAIRFEIALEIALLCESLGSWALVDSDDIFPDRLHRDGGRRP